MSNQQKIFYLANAEQTLTFGNQLAVAIKSTNIPINTIYLVGDLGAGKTTMVRGVLQGFGHTGSTKSPTYTLVEPYELADINLYHFDLYRLADPEELEFIGIREYVEQEAILLFEWPANGQGMIPAADLLINLEYQGEGRRLTVTCENSRLLQHLA